MMNVLAVLVGVIFPVASAYLVKWLMNVLKNASTLVANARDEVKQVLVVLIATVISIVFGFFGIQVTGTTFDALTATDVQALLTAALAMVFHNGKKLKEVAPAETRPA